MQQTWKMRLVVALVLLGVATYFVYPTIVYFTLGEQELKEVRQNKEAFSHYLPSWGSVHHIVPGIDLQGGIHMVLGVDLDKAITDKTSRTADRLVAFAKDEGITVTAIHQSGETQSLEDQVEVTLPSSEDAKAFQNKVLKKFPDFVFVSAGEKSVLMRLDPSLIQTIRSDSINQAMKTITNRVDKMGVTEPSISKRGDSEIQLQLAGGDPRQAKDLLGRTAQLQFQMVDDDATFMKDFKDLPEGVTLDQSSYSRSGTGSRPDIYLIFDESKLQAVKVYLQDKVPSNNVVKFGYVDASRPGSKTMRTYTLDRKVPLTGDDLNDARVHPGSTMDPRPGVSLSFNAVGAKIFAQLTEQSVGKRLAIVLEDRVDSAPVIMTKIQDGNASISMGGAKTNQEMMHEANQLALVLKSGALPAPVTFREERTVGPSLGKDAIEQGRIAFAFGAILISLFMILYYRAVGFISVIGVVFNMAFVLAMLSILNATVTLPGVAALLLTIGMAVDANVIINERIREELRLGKMPHSAVKTGYATAFSAVIDTHVTTFISGLVLWQFGTGPVQNFATLLMIGTVASVFTAVYITRIFVDMLTSRGQKTLSI